MPCKKIGVGSKVVPRIGTYKGKTLKVISTSRVVQGSKHLGTRRGQTIYWASPKGNAHLQAWYLKKHFNQPKRRRKR